MRNGLLAAAIFAGAIGVSAAQADTVGAVAGAGTGLLVAGPPGAVVGGVVGAVWGRPFWGPSISRSHCWTDSDFRRGDQGKRLGLLQTPLARARANNAPAHQFLAWLQ